MALPTDYSNGKYLKKFAAMETLIYAKNNVSMAVIYSIALLFVLMRVLRLRNVNFGGGG